MTAARSARIELLERLLDEGATLGELRRAVRDGRLALLPVERALSNDVRIGSAELARLRGLDLAFVLSVRRALGLPDADPEEPVFREADVETFRELGNVRREARLADDGMLEVLGVVGRSLWKISETTLAVVDEAVSGSSVNECDLAMRYAQVALQLGTVAGPLLESAMHAHLREGLREEVVTPEELRSGIDDTWTVTVCFVDLVGIHGARRAADGRRSPCPRSGAYADRGERGEPPGAPRQDDGRRRDARVDRGSAPHRRRPGNGGEGAEDGRLPPLRAGISHGEAFARGGDWYGATVNLASRVMEIAEPGTILATRGARDAALDGYAWSPAGRERLRGITDEVELFRVASSSPP